MSPAASCLAWLPAAACAGGGIVDLLLYLLPSIALALLLWIASGAHPFFFVFTAAGTLCHELAHFSVGLLTNAEPVGLSVLPRRIKRPGKGHNWELGSVTFANLRWYNAAPSALAPLLVLGLPFAVAWWRTRHGWQFAPVDLLLAVVLAPQFLSFWPSPVDWRLAARSWPWIPVVLVVVLAMEYGAGLAGLVKG